MSKRELLEEWKKVVIKDEDRPISRGIFEFIQTRNIPKYLRFCFVEGNTDKKFYNGNLYKIMGINQDEVKFISNGENGGKEKVLKLYRFINANFLKISISKCIFIVDRDYDELERYSFLSQEELDRITVLPCYSFENYYLYEHNLRAIFGFFDVNNIDGEIERFNIRYKQFIDSIKKYSAIKRTIVKYNLKQLNSLKPDPEKILKKNNSKPNKEFKKIISEAEIELKEKYNESIYNKYLKSIDYISCYPEMVKGKLVFDFLIKHFVEKFNIYSNMNTWYDEIGSLFRLDLEIKYNDI